MSELATSRLDAPPPELRDNPNVPPAGAHRPAYDVFLSIDVPAKDGVVVGVEADRIAWAQDAYARLLGLLREVCDDGRVLTKIAGVTITRRPLARSFVRVELNLHCENPGAMPAGARALTEPEAKRQFWLHVTGAWATVREGDAREAGSSVARTAA